MPVTKEPFEPSHWDLSDAPLFAGADMDAFRKTLAECTTRRLSHGECLLEPGAENRLLYVVLAGSLTVHVDDPASSPLATLGRGACVGELSLAQDQAATAYVIADGDTRVLLIDAEHFWRMVAVSPLISRNLMRILAERIRLNTEVIRQGRELDRGGSGPGRPRDRRR